MRHTRFTARQRQWAAQGILVTCVAILIVLVTQEHFLPIGIFQRLELASLDYRFQLRGTSSLIQDSSDVVIVEISEESFSSLPEKFPWPRSYYARLVRNLKAAGARVVGIDLILSGVDAYAPAHDDSFRTAIRDTRIVVLAGKREADNPNYIKTTAWQNFGNLFFDTDSAIGLVNIRPDPDGVYRLYNVLYMSDTAAGGEVAVPTFAFAILNKYFGSPPSTTPVVHPGEFTYAGRSLPKYDAASVLVNFYGPSGTFRHVKFHDVLDDADFTTLDEAASGEQINTFSDPDYGYLHDGTFTGKVVLVGVTVPEYKDLFPVSIARGKQRGDNLMYGVEIHANVIQNVLWNDFLRKEGAVAEVLAVFFLILLTFAVTSSLKSLATRRHLLVELYGVLFTAAELVVIVVASYVLFTEFRYVTAVVSPMVAVAAGYVTSTVYHFVAERKQRLLIKSMFSTYVNPSLVDQLIAHPETLVLGGRRQELTVLFSDIEGFTTISQHMPPEELVALLNDYMSVMTDIIFRNDGTLDKYEGDAVMAFWGAPIPLPDHALRACTSALQMQQTLRHMNDTWQLQRRPVLKTRIGINTGDMVVGNMGASGRFAYTVIGDSVNLASRLEGANKEYRTGLMVSQRTYDLVRHRILGRELDRIAVKGRSEPVTTFELLQMIDDPVDSGLRTFLERYTAGMAAYRNREWSQARGSFEQALQLLPDDYPARLYIERAAAYELHPPPDDWNGIFILKSK